MNLFINVFIVLLIVIVIGVMMFINKQPQTDYDNAMVVPGKEYSIHFTSKSFEYGNSIPDKFTCTAENVNPDLSIDNVPDVIKSWVLIVDDPDAPAKTWLHWMLFNIPAGVREIAQSTIPTGAVAGMNDFGKLEYGGPCPPSGIHRYFFRLYGLDTLLELDEGASRTDVEAAMQDHVVAEAVLMGTYQKP